MRRLIQLATVLVALVLLVVPSAAQTREGVMGEILRDIGMVEKKVLGLARAMPAAGFDWRPGTGVRSTGEVLMHIAADNYFMPAAMGIPAPEETGITKEYDTAAAFEKKQLSRDAIIAEVEKSFAYLKSSMSAMPDDKLNDALQVFGMKTTNRGMWIMATTHLHEHLGQLIAYARSNKVTPPWSK
jgi:hypothetical protein